MTGNQRNLKENESKENEMYIRKKRILVGVNKYNEEENKISDTDHSSKIKSKLNIKTIEDLNFDQVRKNIQHLRIDEFRLSKKKLNRSEIITDEKPFAVPTSTNKKFCRFFLLLFI